jgi:vacuolar ATPase assembly integral membrane protein VMA21
LDQAELRLFRSVIYKLLGFTVAMVAIPIGSYFATVNVVFRGDVSCTACHAGLRADGSAGNATYAGGLAAIMANVVLIAYILVAWNEDQSEKLAEQQKAKKAQ